MKKPGNKSAKKAARPAAQTKKPAAKAAKQAPPPKQAAPAKQAVPAAPKIQPYTPGPIQGIGWKPFRYPPD